MNLPSINYDESKVPSYTLPDPLLCADGTKVADVETWRNKRRPEILNLFAENIYGKTPGKSVSINSDAIEQCATAFNGRAIRKQVDVWLTEANSRLRMRLLIYLPKKARHPVPVFVGLNFKGNHAVRRDPAIILPEMAYDIGDMTGEKAAPGADDQRGEEQDRWQVECLLSRGYGLVTCCYNDIDPDFNDGFKNGAHPLFYHPGQTKPATDEWGSIGAWAWGLSRIMDYIETDPDIDKKRVAVMGHSRLGKTALWAGAQDERFALVISNSSGCGGASLARRRFGETVARINTVFPHWFCGNYKKFNDNEDSLPVDQHMLIALMAPRPVYIASAAKDLWADPKGEFLSAVNAHTVYQLLGTDGIASNVFPAISHPLLSTIGYHIRPGEHDVTGYDWNRFMDFADCHLLAKTTGR